MGYGTWKARVGGFTLSSPPLVWEIPEAALQTFKEGDLVYRSGGYLTVCGADPALILGIAKENAHNDAVAATHNILVDVITTWVLVEMCIYHVTAGTNVIEVADRGKAYGVVVNSNVWHVDKNDVSATRLRVEKFRDALGTENGRVMCQFFAANLEVT